MLIVKAQFEDNLYTEMILETIDNPCLCKISDKFEIVFLESIPETIGIVEKWDLRDIDLRIPAGVGGEYNHLKYGLITIKHQKEDLYIIQNLKMFVRGQGWMTLIENTQYTEIMVQDEPEWLKNL